VCLITTKWRAFLISILLAHLKLFVSCTGLWYYSDQVSLKVRKIFSSLKLCTISIGQNTERYLFWYRWLFKSYLLIQTSSCARTLFLLLQQTANPTSPFWRQNRTALRACGSLENQFRQSRHLSSVPGNGKPVQGPQSFRHFTTFLSCIFPLVLSLDFFSSFFPFITHAAFSIYSSSS
jgi:hypothetical protein